MSVEPQTQVCLGCKQPIPKEGPGGLCPVCLLNQALSFEKTGERTGSEVNSTPSMERLRSAFPHLEIVECIGRGGMGFVYKARQPQLNRFVALKVLPENLVQKPGFMERFAWEGKIMAILNHPNIVSIYDLGQAGEFPYLLMEYVDGMSVRQAIES